MGTYGYCVVPPGHEPSAQLHGLDGAIVVAQPIANLAVWVSRIDRPEPNVEHAKIHNNVVEAAVTQEVTPVPLRFGQWAEEGGVLYAAIESRADWYEQRLRAFAGALEFGIRVVDPDRAAPARVVRAGDAVTGLEYMKALRDRTAAAQAERDVADRVCVVVREVLGAFVREEKVEDARSTRGLVNVAHLVARDQFAGYREQAERLKLRFPELRFLLSGPWVPYSFAV